LWYVEIEYKDIGLGSLVSVWSPHISAVKQDTNNEGPAALMISIFPERDGGCQIAVLHTVSAAVRKIPVGYPDGERPLGLNTLAESKAPERQGKDSKVLVYVKGVGKIAGSMFCVFVCLFYLHISISPSSPLWSCFICPDGALKWDASPT
jgi:hypothetical protein